uniref:Uncharacterized protein n=1 Tax=Lepeophtheirus salmonis TaxID=72036 RepID=A0A0K2TBB3_LEPSM
MVSLLFDAFNSSIDTVATRTES